MEWTHDALVADLATHLRATHQMLWTDMQLGPSGSMRPDVYVLPSTYKALRPVAYECKVSRSDLMSDLSKGKWMRYLGAATGVYLAVPAGLCKPDEVPSQMGIIVRHDSVWRTARRATMQPLHGGNLAWTVWVKLLMGGTRSEAQRRTWRERPSADSWLWGQRARNLLGERVAEAMRELSGAEALLRQNEKRVMALAKEQDEIRAKEVERIRLEARYSHAAADQALRDAREALGLPEGAGWAEVAKRGDQLVGDYRTTKDLLRSVGYAVAQMKRALQGAHARVRSSQEVRSGG